MWGRPQNGRAGREEATGERTQRRLELSGMELSGDGCLGCFEGQRTAAATTYILAILFRGVSGAIGKTKTANGGRITWDNDSIYMATAIGEGVYPRKILSQSSSRSALALVTMPRMDATLSEGHDRSANRDRNAQRLRQNVQIFMELISADAGPVSLTHWPTTSVECRDDRFVSGHMPELTLATYTPKPRRCI